MRLQSSLSRSIVGLHLLSHLDIVVSVGSLRRTFSIPWNGNNYADARSGLHPYPCLRIQCSKTSMHKQAIRIRNPTSRTLHHQNTRDGAVHGVSAAFKLGKKRKNIPNPPKRQPPPLPADGNGTPLVHLPSLSWERTHRCHLQSTREKQTLFKKCFNSAQRKHFRKAWESK